MNESSEASGSLLATARRMSRDDGFVFLDSSRRAYGMGRYSILGSKPRAEIRYKEGRGEILRGDALETFEEEPFLFLKRVLAEFGVEDSAREPGLAGGGFMGYLSYDLGRYIERVPSLAKAEGAYDLRFFYFERLLVWDSVEGTWSGARVEKDDEGEGRGTFEVGALGSNFSEERYVAAVERIHGLIKAGEVYQVNLSQQLSASFEGEEWALYEELRKKSPSQYGAYLNFGDEVILSSSPEKFLTKKGSWLETRPIKGTRPRGVDKKRDAALRTDLSESEKDRSELLMIVDLERNDLGRVCRPGSIEVSGLFQQESYATVIHQTATVSGELDTRYDGVDSIKALFPGGSITGAPKIRAMEVIEELEPVRRGVYTGAIGYFGLDGNFDFNIAIRTMRVAEGEVRFNVGGGIVWDSDPKSEYVETLDKARSMMAALGKEIDE